MLFDRDITRPGQNLSVDQSIDAGVENNCPFCLARRYDRPGVNEELLFLSGDQVGATGKVIATEADWLSNDEFAVAFPWSGRGVTHRVSPANCLFIKPSLLQIPKWLAQFSTEDLFQLDEIALRTELQYGISRHAMNWPDEALFVFADYLWRRRLPIMLDELAVLLKMHRILLQAAATRFTKRVLFARDMLAWSQGRLPIKRKRIGTFAAERYMTPRDFVT